MLAGLAGPPPPPPPIERRGAWPLLPSMLLLWLASNPRGSCFAPLDAAVALRLLLRLRVLRLLAGTLSSTCYFACSAPPHPYAVLLPLPLVPSGVAIERDTIVVLPLLMLMLSSVTDAMPS